jgi:hypothetical protein
MITGANLGKNAMLAFRILTSSGKIYLEYVVNKVGCVPVLDQHYQCSFMLSRM